jgi:predicted ATPase
MSEELHEYIYNHILAPEGQTPFDYTDGEIGSFVKMSESFTKDVPANSSKWLLESSILDQFDVELGIKKDEHAWGSDYELSLYGEEYDYDYVKQSIENDKKQIEERANDEEHIIAILDLFLDFYKSLVDSWIDRQKPDSEFALRLRDFSCEVGAFDKMPQKTKDYLNDKIQNKMINRFLNGTNKKALDDTQDLIKNHLSGIFDFLSKGIYYLGPLREDPKPLYPFPNNNDSFDLGRKGEHTAGVLFLHGEEKSNFQLPNQKEDEVKTIDAIKQWLAYIGVADDITVEIIKPGIFLKIKAPGSDEFTDLTNVGVGVSQVIPIVVMCLTARKGTTLVIEQPELHLHPKMQTKLAEFFMAIADSGVQCIIETHSEHFINAMRLNIASDELGKEKMIDKSVIYFVEKIQNSSIFREIKINDLGIIPHWPKDFFDEDINQTDKIILASSKKRAQKFPEDEETDDE